jgi:hypothetical protein
MRKAIWLALLALTLGGAASSGCMVRERTVARTGPGGCPGGGVFIEGHYGPRGRWHPGHWRCHGVVERVEID